MPTKPEDSAARASDSVVQDTYYQHILKRVSVDTIDGLLKTVAARDQGTTYRLAGALGLFNSKLSQAKQWAYQAFLLGDPFNRYRSQINHALKLDKTGKTAHDYGFAKVPFTKRLDEDSSDVLRKSTSLDLFSALHKATSSIIDYFKERNEGHTTKLIEDLKGAANRIFTQCGDLGLIDQPFNKKDPLSIYACAVLMYLGERDGTSDRLAQAKMKLVKDSYTALRTTLEQRRIGASQRGERIDECAVVLKEIENVITRHNALCQEYKVAGALPVSLGYVVSANLPFSLTPSEGSLGEKLGWAQTEVQELQKVQLAEAEESKHVASMTH